MLRQNAVDRRTQPHKAAAQRKGIDPEWLDQIIGGGICARAQNQYAPASCQERNYGSIVVRARAGVAPTRCPLLQAPGENTLLGVQPVLGLVPNYRLRA